MAASKRKTPAIDLAQYAREHIAYEAKMFAEARDMFFRKAKDQNVPMNETTLVAEACLLHFRNIVDFFYPGTVRPDDVVAVDYAPDWNTKRPPISSSLNSARARTHKELAHLTLGRKDRSAPDKGWDLLDLSADVTCVIEAFIKSAEPKLPSDIVAELRKIACTSVSLAGGPPIFNSSGPPSSSP